MDSVSRAGEGGGDANLMGEIPPFDTGDIGDFAFVDDGWWNVGDNKDELAGNLKPDVSTGGSRGGDLDELLDGELTLGTGGSGWRAGRRGVGTCSLESRGGEEGPANVRGGAGGDCIALNLMGRPTSSVNPHLVTVNHGIHTKSA
jgi:hypothetical protein